MTIIRDQEKVRKIVKDSGSSFYWGMNVLDKDKKRAMFSLYCFCRIVDDIADSDISKNQKINQLRKWGEKINKVFEGNHEDFITRELVNLVKNYKVKKEDFISIIKGMEMDINELIVYPSKKKIEIYCDRVAGAVGCISVKIFGINDVIGDKYAIALGRAFQITNICRDLKEDSIRNRCYIPIEYVKKYKLHKLRPKDLMEHGNLEKIQKLLLNDAKYYFNLSNKISSRLEKKKIMASELMKEFYTKIFKELNSGKFDINKKVKLKRFEKIKIIFKYFTKR